MTQELKIYEVLNRVTRERLFLASDTPEHACQQQGWIYRLCYVKEVTPRNQARIDNAEGLLVKLPCEVCQYQYCECHRPWDAQCPLEPLTPDLTLWAARALEAHLCHHAGEVLERDDYLKRQKWVPIAQAIDELSTQPTPDPHNLPQSPCQAPTIAL